jgi:hypothetical protein
MFQLQGVEKLILYLRKVASYPASGLFVGKVPP